MFFNSTTIFKIIVSVMARILTRLALAAAAILFLGSASVSLAAVWPGYTFLTVTDNGLGGNAATAAFSGANGVINVTHAFSSGGAGGNDNDNFNSQFDPGQFTPLFPGTGLVQGHLAQTVYAHTSVITFDMTGYAITPNTAFGIWNTSDEVTAPVGGNPVYRVQLIDNTNTQVNPNTFFYMGNQDNLTQVAGKHQMLMNTSTGEITFGALINSFGTHTDATFWKNIPTTTQKIIVYGDLPPLNTIGDGVGYYFAELGVPEPCSAALSTLGLLTLGIFGRRRRP